MDTLRALKASNAAMAASMSTMVASHVTVVEKLNLMEMAVVTVQAGMRAVHDVIEKVAENVNELTDLNVEAARRRGVECEEIIEKEPWKGKGLVAEGLIAEPHCTPNGQKACTLAFNTGMNGSTFLDSGYIAETQNHTQYVERLTEIAKTPEDEYASDREAEYAAALGQSMPRDTQERTLSHNDTEEEESQQIALSCPSAQPKTPAPGDQMWNEFRAAVQLWPPPTPEGQIRLDGWVSAKRVRAASPDSEQETMDPSHGTCDADNLALNLNEMPERHVADQAGIVAPLHDPHNGDTAPPKRGGRGGGRVGGKGRRPPPMRPRFHSTVSWMSCWKHSNCSIHKQ